ncbi:uncharacterized protein EDB91DRAFT_1155352 [Suillus paluster]|uniref:uncharacterized protein n=1 Tax=Suillus paluster TaxID=48578 RepID=UPI001B8604C5|nr:uncharacterized protein EDB91DRAFT_1155352 [Suillus paluster]KAG1731072.1 hypothetical protein EDB91DRAFT_1155352 [Suillus paluster]
MTQRLIYFVNDLDPNGPFDPINWPKWTSSSRELITFIDPFFQEITQDTFLAEAISYLK